MRSKTNLTVSMVLITPELAENYLKFNDKNRTPSKSMVTSLTKQMVEGTFLENGESIVFDSNESLVDGQQRLFSIIKSGKSYNIPVVRGVEPKAIATYDTGKNRSAADVLGMNGFKDTKNLASLIQLIKRFNPETKNAHKIIKTVRDKALTHQSVLNYCSDNYDWLHPIVDKTQDICKAASIKVLQPSQTAFYAYLLGGKEPSHEVYTFLKQVVGVSVVEVTATSYLHSKLQLSKIKKEPLNKYWVTAMVIKAWNYFSEGNPSVSYFKFDVSKSLPTINKEFQK